MTPRDPRDATVEWSAAGAHDTVAQRYREAWQAALAGGPMPDQDTFLQGLAEPHRSEVHRQLASVDMTFRSQLSSHAVSATIAHAGDLSVETPPGEPPPSTQARAIPAGIAPTIDPHEPQHVQAASELPDAQRMPGYEILGELGRGAMGVVYKARQTGLNRTVALKMLLAGTHAGPEQLARFYTEAEAVARLQHPNIVQIYEVGRRDGLAFFTLEFVDGSSLSQKLGGKPQPPREAAQLVEILARATHYAHENGIVHRDLKPANVLLTHSGVPKITDFGLAKQLEADQSHTQSGTIMGTASYMAPEQARGDVKAIGPAADQHALGAMLYEMLTGRPPYLSATIVETVMLVIKQTPVPPSRLEPKVHRDLETICLKCLQKEPPARYESCAALADDLRRFVAGEPILARPVRAPERLVRWCRRNPRIATLTGAVLALLCVSIVALSWMGLRVMRERRAVAETRDTTRERLDEALQAIRAGDARRARDLARWDDPVLASVDALADLRHERAQLAAQVEAYAEFKRLMDQVRFAALFSARGSTDETRKLCWQLLELYDESESLSGRAPFGMPPLDDARQALLREDVFEALLIAAQVETDLPAGSDDAQTASAVTRAIEWLDRAKKVLPTTRVLYQRRGEYHRRLGHDELAQHELQRAAETPVTSAVDLFWQGYDEHLLASAAARLGRLPEKQTHLAKALAAHGALLRIRPDHFWGYFGWATSQVAMADPVSLANAVVGFTACIHLQPELPWPYYNRGTVHLNLKQLDEAIKDFDTALALDATYAEAYLNRGLAHREAGRADEAWQDIGQAIAIRPNYALAYSHRGETHRIAKRYTDALGEYDRAIELGAITADAFFGRAICHFAGQQYAPARDDFSMVLRMDPARLDSYRFRGFANLVLRDIDAALADWQMLAQLQPTNTEAYKYVGVIRMGRREYEKALAALESAISIRGDYNEALLARAQIRHWQGRHEEALADIDGVLARLATPESGILNDRADVLRSLNRLDDAADAYRQSIAVAPKQTEAYVGLALVLAMAGRPLEAAACYEDLIAAHSDSSDAWLRRAEFRRNGGQFEEALADCDEALRREADSATANLVRASIHAARGDHAPAVEEAERILAASATDNGHVLYAAACVYSLAAGAAAGQEAAAYVDRAAELIARMLDKGFHDLKFEEHNYLAHDPALAAVRLDPRVRPLLEHAEHSSTAP